MTKLINKSELNYYGVTQAAKMFNVSGATVRRAIADGSLASIKIGGSVRIPKAAIDAIVAMA